jgi:hypothetical protein
MKFRLFEKSRNKVKTTFVVVNQAGDICGSINVSNESAGDLLRCWQGPVGDSPQSRSSSPNALAASFMKHRKPFLQGAILRGCNG